MEYAVRDLMVPLSEYATVPTGSSVFEAVFALEKAQEEYDHSKYHHRAVLVMDQDGKVVGKLSQLDVLRSINAGNRQMEEIGEIGRFGFSPNFIGAMHEKHRPKGRSLQEICRNPAKMRVEEFMQAPSEYEYIRVDASLDEAIHQLAAGPYLSLMVMEEGSVIGILRMSDVFAAIFHAMKENETSG
ncbi:MAG: CBS domain-containing protein [Desulfobacterales bacterium]